jgi:antitoxin (DNA-binding transcriptional repressor) of toxin-antitoxin stability system
VLELSEGRNTGMGIKMIDVKKEHVPLNELLALVASGTDVILTEGESPVARVVSVPHKAAAHRLLGLHAGKIWISPDFSEPLPDSFWLGENHS